MRSPESQVHHRLDLNQAESIFELLNEGVVYVDKEDTIRFANSRFCELIGRDREDVVGKKTQSVFKILSSNKPIHSIFEARYRGQPDLYEIELESRGGSPKWFRISSSPTVDGDGKYTGSVEVYRSITDQKLAENLLKESESRFRQLADSTPVMIWMSDRENNFYYFNKAWLDFTGRSLEDELGLGWKEHVHPEDGDSFQAEVEDSRRRKAPFKLEHRLLRADGQFSWLLTIGHPRFLPDGSYAGYIGSSVDISDMKTIQKELEHQTRELQRSNEELEQFAYVASHDLHEPLRMVSSFVQIIQGKLLNNPELNLDEYIGFAISGVQRMQQLIDDLLDYSRVKSKGNPFEVVDCNRILEIVRHTLSNRIEEQTAEIEWNELPTIKADKSQIERLFQNLIENSLKFRSDAPPRLRIHGEEDDVFYRFSVADNGIGIEEKFYDRIFVIFQRLHSRKDYQGTGIGLSICKRIVERHGGKIWLESEENRGTTFHFTFKKEPGEGAQP